MIMNASKKKSEIKEGPLFKFDPDTGKHILLPAPWLASSETQPTRITSSDKKTKMIVLTPLKLTPADFEDSPCTAAKVRKIDNNSVRKGLFNVPSVTITSHSTNRQSITRRRSINIKKMQQRKKKPPQLSPLLDMEEVEEELLSKKGLLHGYPFKTPKKPTLNFSKNCPTATKAKPQMKSPKKDIEKTPDSTSSNEKEFLALEQMCCESDPDKGECKQSPVSAVCNLLEGTVLNSVKKQKITSDDSTDIQAIITDIRNLLEENKINVERYKTNYEEYSVKISELLKTQKNNHQKFIAHQEEFSTAIIKKLESLVPGSFVEDEADNKENLPARNRRSVRLLHKNPPDTNSGKLVVSPVIMKSGDLRKTTLTKNLVTKSQQYQIQSPRIQKALNLYNTLRNDVSILSTPKLDRQYLIESPKSSNLSRILSRRVQSQCLLLQDTPVHRK